MWGADAHPTAVLWWIRRCHRHLAIPLERPHQAMATQRDLNAAPTSAAELQAATGNAVLPGQTRDRRKCAADALQHTTVIVASPAPACH